MELVLIGLATLLTSGLTLFSGFGLGTILMPVFTLFFPLLLAIAATVVVHSANNLFKFELMARQSVGCRSPRSPRLAHSRYTQSTGAVVF
jgi:uncharacterized membrane protein YfcA